MLQNNRKHQLYLIAAAISAVAIIAGCRQGKQQEYVALPDSMQCPDTMPSLSTQPPDAITIDVEDVSTDETTAQIPSPLNTQFHAPLPAELMIHIQQECDRYDVPYNIALAVIECESAFRLDADSGTCYGLMQINRSNYNWLRELGFEPTDPKGNISSGLYILGMMLDKYKDEHKALMAYNCGEDGARRLWSDGVYSTEYSRKIMKTSDKY